MTDHRPTVDGVVARRAAWLAALRSGDYAQTVGALRVDDTYCCLGVAENLRGATWLPVDRDVDDLLRGVLEHTGTHELHVPGRDVAEGVALTPAGMRWYGLASPTPHVVLRCPTDGSWRVTTLPELNDDWGLSFEAIADVLEDQAPGWTGDEAEARADAARRDLPPDGGTS